MGGALRAVATEAEFEQLLATATQPVLVDLGATWCGPCQVLTPILEDFAASCDTVQVVTLDADSPRALAWRLGGASIPRMYLFDRGHLQLEVSGVRDLGWLQDVVGGYAALGIEKPDGPSLAQRTPARSIVLPTLGMALVINGDDDGFQRGQAPCSLDATRGSTTRLMVTAAEIDGGALDDLDPGAFDELTLTQGPVTRRHLEKIARLTGLRRFHCLAPGLSSEDLLALADLDLRSLDVGSVAVPEGVFADLVGQEYWSPSLLAARAAAGLSDRSRAEVDGEKVEVACRSERREDGDLDFVVTLTVAEGWYAYPPGSDEGVPVSLDVVSDHTVVVPLVAVIESAHLQARAQLRAVLSGDADEVRLYITVQVCDGSVCNAPQSTLLVVPTTRAG